MQHCGVHAHHHHCADILAVQAAHKHSRDLHVPGPCGVMTVGSKAGGIAHHITHLCGPCGLKSPDAGLNGLLLYKMDVLHIHRRHHLVVAADNHIERHGSRMGVGGGYHYV